MGCEYKVKEERGGGRGKKGKGKRGKGERKKGGNVRRERVGRMGGMDGLTN